MTHTHIHIARATGTNGKSTAANGKVAMQAIRRKMCDVSEYWMCELGWSMDLCVGVEVWEVQHRSSRSTVDKKSKWDDASASSHMAHEKRIANTFVLSCLISLLQWLYVVNSPNTLFVAVPHVHQSIAHTASQHSLPPISTYHYIPVAHIPPRHSWHRWCLACTLILIVNQCASHATFEPT